MAAKKLRAIVGINFSGNKGEDVRVEAGEITDAIPAKSVAWLREQGLAVDADQPVAESAPEPPVEAPVASLDVADEDQAA